MLSRKNCQRNTRTQFFLTNIRLSWSATGTVAFLFRRLLVLWRRICSKVYCCGLTPTCSARTPRPLKILIILSLPRRSPSLDGPRARIRQKLLSMCLMKRVVPSHYVRTSELAPSGYRMPPLPLRNYNRVVKLHKVPGCTPVHFLPLQL